MNTTLISKFLVLSRRIEVASSCRILVFTRHSLLAIPSITVPWSVTELLAGASMAKDDQRRVVGALNVALSRGVQEGHCGTDTCVHA